MYLCFLTEHQLGWKPMDKVYLAPRNLRNGYYTLYAEYSHARQVKRIPTGARCASSNWCVTSRKAIGTGAKEINAQVQPVLDTLKAQVQHLYLQNGSLYPPVEQLNRHRASLEHTLQAVSTEPPLRQVLTEWMATKVDWKTTTRRSYTTLHNNIRDFERAKRTTWYLSSLTNADIRTWQTWLKDNKHGKDGSVGYADSVLEKRLRLLRTFLGKRHAPQVNLDDEATKRLHQIMLTTPVVLTPAELEALAALPLTTGSRLDRVRDLALLQSFCGLRISDMKRLETRFVCEGFISLNMWKSGTKAVWVHIPIFPHAARVLAKYTVAGELKLKTFSDQKFNDYFKELCQLVPALLRTHLQEYSRHGVRGVRKQAKWLYLTSHSLRRTFVTMCLELGFSAHEIMSWSGHTDWKSFQRYVGKAQQRPDAASDFARRWEERRLVREQSASEYAVSMQLEPPEASSTALAPR
ncbi:tyrosine-type recombinase/integrase [Hymenobacter jejuensis]|uniref:Tyr recombinase domain-containing protein n=1 Tax=Hymenobacter jejuensis TaxID=2502781 RepID=A0A5B7ZVI8_9BACT|nr:tyrosine-type recombinase/integrase [Hymenobacter jejuensis]QDA59028.1 hypothetical protein FHG12_02430 [Hymenobacter jejuensis]